MNFSKLFPAVALVAAASFYSVSAFAQSNYVKIGGGYNLGIGSQFGQKTLITSTINQDNNLIQSTEKIERVRVNFGKGFTGNIAFGFMFSEQLGVEVEVNYLAGGKNNTSFQRNASQDSISPFINKTEMHARMIIFQPSFVMITKLSEHLNLHGKFGIATGTGTIFINDYLSDNWNEVIQEAEYKGGWGFGVQGALGLDYKINDKYAVFSEIKMSNLSYAPNKYQLTKQIHNGHDDLYPAEQKEISLENSFTNTTIKEVDWVNVKHPFNFSTVGLNIGLKYNF
ncbi:outer membrane beta-barrel protein [Adhaeribacter soli]|uniref:Porin family protein n=1 Tax=Adhaeribacter soli TaxID=2607655 RepID=A0A5N1J4M7_9BACT|nr:outer membrane beta-barrel protein [Adhaeribacter soli]KAA9340029.1 porin family protein [Adhaeribacter soli]